jgi:Aldo/keto reductase family
MATHAAQPFTGTRPHSCRYYGCLCRYEADRFSGLNDGSSRSEHSRWLARTPQAGACAANASFSSAIGSASRSCRMPLGGIGQAAHLGVRFPSFQRVAEETGATPQQVTLAWMLAQSPRVIPIPGSSRPETIRHRPQLSTSCSPPNSLTGSAPKR